MIFSPNPNTYNQTAYIPTVFIKLDLKCGDVWYCKLPGGNMLQHCKIVEITEKTVLLKDLDSKYDAFGRYKKTDIEFVEKLEK